MRCFFASAQYCRKRHARMRGRYVSGALRLAPQCSPRRRQARHPAHDVDGHDCAPAARVMAGHPATLGCFGRGRASLAAGVTVDARGTGGRVTTDTHRARARFMLPLSGDYLAGEGFGRVGGGADRSSDWRERAERNHGAAGDFVARPILDLRPRAERRCRCKHACES